MEEKKIEDLFSENDPVVWKKSTNFCVWLHVLHDANVRAQQESMMRQEFWFLIYRAFSAESRKDIFKS